MEPRTHYQISLTARQAFSLFIGLLAVLGLSYFFGLMTGLSGREPGGGEPAPQEASNEQIAAANPPSERPAEGRESLAFPVPVTAVPPGGGPAVPPASIQVFEDGVGGAKETVSPRPRPATPRAEAASGGFRVQVLSVSSRSDAEAEAARLTRQGLAARVEPGAGPRGTVYRVRVGPFATREEAEAASRRLSSEGRRDTWIVRPGQ